MPRSMNERQCRCERRPAVVLAGKTHPMTTPTVARGRAPRRPSSGKEERREFALLKVGRVQPLERFQRRVLIQFGCFCRFDKAIRAVLRHPLNQFVPRAAKTMKRGLPMPTAWQVLEGMPSADRQARAPAMPRACHSGLIPGSRHIGSPCSMGALIFAFGAEVSHSAPAVTHGMIVRNRPYWVNVDPIGINQYHVGLVKTTGRFQRCRSICNTLALPVCAGRRRAAGQRLRG